ncbi:hypothetical protein K402DRAFT_420547 [Aulographum hederae CBS 113979]|uniref:Uncharacterized protein n=1 Tax=Aulographum hederae CBS 113979 TaxID=1176131 RepID=A0A6G1H2Z0_9PEZI|nr:hypothetical protein K402DRAFT_420547 [Aulographum hederae CBS 113979]
MVLMRGKSQKPLSEAGYQGQALPPSAPFGVNDPSGNYLGAFGLDGKAPWNHDYIQLNGKNPQTDLPILETYESKDQKAVIVKNSWGKSEDPNPALSWTAMTMSNWRAASGDGVKDLKFIVRDNVQSVNTVSSEGITLNSVNAINQAFTRMDAPKQDTLELSLDRNSPNVNEIAAFELMAAQTHVARVYQMLKDYRSELGNLDIAKLHLQTNKQNPSTVAQYNIIIELGPR